MRTILLKLLIAASALLGNFAMAQTVNWANWTAPGSYPSSVSGPGTTIRYANGASGSLTLPDSTVAAIKVASTTVPALSSKPRSINLAFTVARI